MINDNENWCPEQYYPINRYFVLPKSNRITMSGEKKGVIDKSRWVYRDERTGRWGRIDKYYHAMFFKPHLEYPIMRLKEPTKQISSLLIGSKDEQEMVHVNSTYVMDAIYDKLFYIRK